MSFPPAPEKVRRILVCQLRQIGDVLLSTPAIELLRRQYPAAEIHFFTEKKCTPMLEGNPNIHTLWALDRKKLPTLLQEIAWYWQVARQGYDMVIDFQQLPRCRWVVGFSGAPVRLTHTPPWYNRPLYTHWTDMRGGYSAMSKASVLEPLGIRWNGEKPRLYLAGHERDAMRTMLAGLGLQAGHRLVTVDPTHRRATRRWPAEHYARLMTIAAERDASLRFLPLWGPGEEDDIRAMVAASGCAERILLPQRMLTLREMAACIGEAALHVGNCSAPRHIAVAVDTPSFVILGSTAGAWTFPSPEHRHIASTIACQPCNRNECDHISCLNGLDPAVVADVMLEHMQQFCGK